jgi:hypothetical protein
METSTNVQESKPVKVDVEKKIELEIEELEPIIAPRLATNHNETLVRDFER